VALDRASTIEIEPIDLDGLAGDWFATGSDPHYSDLPCYVPIVDGDEDEAFDPFRDEGSPANSSPARNAAKGPRNFNGACARPRNKGASR
jgi:hypothetical protein